MPSRESPTTMNENGTSLPTGGAPLYPRRPHPNPVDLEAVKKFERTLHYLRVNVTGNHIEVTASRADGTTIESQAWTDGPGETAAPSNAIVASVPGAGAPAMSPAPVAAAPTGETRRSLGWFVGGGIVLALGAAVVVVRTMRQ